MRTANDLYHVYNTDELIKIMIRNAQRASTRRGGHTHFPQGLTTESCVASGARGRGAGVLAAGHAGMDSGRLHKARRLVGQSEVACLSRGCRLTTKAPS